MSTETDTSPRTVWEEPNAVQIKVTLRDFQFRHGEIPSFVYVYDFGDDWRHTVQIEKLFAVKPAPKTATCIEGARNCPPEDVGGPPGYFEFLRVLLSPEPDEIQEQKHLKRWSGGKFDPERCGEDGQGGPRGIAQTSTGVKTHVRSTPETCFVLIGSYGPLVTERSLPDGAPHKVATFRKQSTGIPRSTTRIAPPITSGVWGVASAAIFLAISVVSSTSISS